MYADCMDPTGQLVRLRGFRTGDAPSIARILSDRTVTRYIGTWAQRPYSIKDAQEFIVRRQSSSLNWAIECLEDGAFIGATGLAQIDLHDRHCQWGIWIGPPERWSKGYGTEACKLAMGVAFGQLRLEKVYLYVFDENQRAKRAYEKAGFGLEGVLPRHAWRDGRFLTAHLMAAYHDHPLYRQAD